MAGLSWMSWIPIAILSSRQTSVAVLCGMIGPLAAVCGTWFVAERTYHERPRALTGVMLAAFGGKFILFPVYLAVMLRVLELRPVPLVSSFIAYFIVLNFVTALFLRRLLHGGMHS